MTRGIEGYLKTSILSTGCVQGALPPLEVAPRLPWFSYAFGIGIQIKCGKYPRILHEMLLVPHKIVVDLNNVLPFIQKRTKRKRKRKEKREKDSKNSLQGVDDGDQEQRAVACAL